MSLPSSAALVPQRVPSIEKQLTNQFYVESLKTPSSTKTMEPGNVAQSEGHGTSDNHRTVWKIIEEKLGQAIAKCPSYKAENKILTYSHMGM
jgi:hypothetical protein